MRKIKKWLCGKFLPAYCRDDLLDTNKRLITKIAEQEQEIERLNAYIDGMQYAMVRQPRVIIKAKEVAR